MKFAFWKKKKKAVPPAEEPQKPAISVFLCGDGARPEEYPAECELISADRKKLTDDLAPATPPALRPASEQNGTRDGPIATSRKNSDTAAEAPADGLPHGRYVFFADGAVNGPAAARALLAEDTTREEELLLIPADDRGARITAESLIQAVQTRQKFGCAASLDLFGRLPATLRCAFRGERTSALLLLARSSAVLERADEKSEPEQMTKTDKANPNAIDIDARTRSLENFIRFFGEIKAQLNEDKYRFAFAYACGRIIGTFAGLAAENQTQELRAFDKFLKEENMALRVAAKERSAIVRRLIRYDYCAPFWLRPLCAAVAAKDRAKE